MGSRIAPGWGLLLIDSRITVEQEAAQGATSIDSSYTQAGPRPGESVPDDDGSTWRPQVTGYQDQAIETITITGGYAGPDRTGRPAAGIAVRTDGATSEDDWIGWDDPVTIRSWTSTAGMFVGSANVDAASMAVVPSTQEVVVVACNSAGGDRRVCVYDPRREAWSKDAATLSGVTISTPIALAYDADAERLILYSGSGDAYDDDTLAFYSDDLGTTWGIYARGLFDQSTSAGRVTVATQPRAAWCMFRGGSGAWGQWSSSDRGMSWKRVDSASSSIDDAQVRVVALASGAYLVVYVEATTLDLRARRLASANQRWSDANVATITSTNTEAFTVAVDADGVVYVHRQDDTNTRILQAYRSLDEGVTWEAYAFDAAYCHQTGDTAYPTLDGAVCAAGQVLILHGMSGAASLSDSRGLLALGGYTSVEGDSSGIGLHARVDRLGFGESTLSGGIYGRAWYPVDAPELFGWNAITAGGTVSWVNTTGGGMRVQATNAVHNWGMSDDSASVMAAEVELSVVAGSLTNGPYFRLGLGDSTTYNYRIDVRFSTTAIKVLDVYGAASVTSGTISTLATTGVRVRAVITTTGTGSAFASVAYREVGTDGWVVLVDKTAITLDTTAGRADIFQWGVDSAAGTTDSVWRIAGAVQSAGWAWGIDDANDLADKPWSEGHLGLRFGRVAPSTPLAYPLPQAAVRTYTLGSPTRCPRVTASGGPARISETGTCALSYERPIEYVYPVAYPSPSRYWQSTGTTEQRIVWSWPRAQWLGDAIGLVVLEAYGRQVALEYYDGAAWQTLGTLDLSLSAGTALNATRTGDVITPRSGTVEIGRYLAEGELIGGYAILSQGASTVARRIIRQSSGYWSASAHQPVRITLEGVTGSEDTSGTVDLIAPSGVLVTYPTAAQARAKWRVKWAASQVTPGSVYRAGVVGVGRVIGVGATPGWDWSRTQELARTVTRDAGGRVRAIRRIGAPRETLSYQWQEGVDLFPLRSSTTPDYVATSTGLAIGSDEDAISLLGHVEHSLESGQVPVVVLPALPASTGTILDPSLYVYGMLSSESVGLSGVDGEEGSSEYVRLTGAAFERIR